MELRFTVPGPPKPKDRARRCADGRFRTPKRTRRYEQLVMIHAMTAASFEPTSRDGVLRRRLPPWPIGYRGRVALELAVYWPDYRRRDVDNVVKSICDGIQSRGAARGVIYDDSQVKQVSVVATTIDRERPRVEVTLRMLEVET